MAFTTEDLQRMIIWSGHYRPEWDNEPHHYVESSTVGWAKSRRLGLLESGRHKAYLGVQHVDPAMPGWGAVGEPHARFFVSMFADGECVALKTAHTMSEALGLVSAFLEEGSGAS